MTSDNVDHQREPAVGRAGSGRRRKCVLVLGMHRSGTSALSGTLAAMGLQRPKRELPPQPDNEKGFFEPREIVAIHDRVLEAFGSRWSDWRSLPKDWVRSATFAAAVDELGAAVRDDFAGDGDFVVKDPRICRFVSLWIELAARLDFDIVVFHIFRRPAEVAASLKARNGMDEAWSNALWLRHVLDAEIATRQLPRRFVNFEDLVDRKRQVFDALLQGIDFETGKSDAPPQTEAIDFLDPSLRRQKILDRAEESFLGWNRSVHEELKRLVVSPYDEGAARTFDNVACQFDRACEYFDPLVRALSFEIERQRAEIAPLRSLESERNRLSSALAAMKDQVDRISVLERDLLAARAQAGLLTEETRLRMALGEELASIKAQLAVSENIAATVPELEQKIAATERRIADIEGAADEARLARSKLVDELGRTENLYQAAKIEAQRVPQLEEDLASAGAEIATLTATLNDRLALLRRVFSTRRRLSAELPTVNGQHESAKNVVD